MASRTRLPPVLQRLASAFVVAVSRLDTSLSPADTLSRLRRHKFTLSDSLYAVHVALATLWLTLITTPSFPAKLLIPGLYAVLLLIPLTSQFFLPAHPIFAWLLAFYSARFIPEAARPSISVSVLPTLEYVLYGANISDILTRFTHPALDILAWLPYGLIHFTAPFVLAAFLWLFRGTPALAFWARVAGYTNLLGVLIQIVLPNAPPWYELVYGLTPANYAMPGHPGGLQRIDALFGGSGYTTGFRASPVVFGAFPSLHSAWATLEALTLSHFFPHTARYAWGYAAVLYWATMYLTHHYLIDVTVGGCFAVAFFHMMLPDDLRGPYGAAQATPTRRNKYTVYDVEAPSRPSLGGLTDGEGEESDNGEEEDITYRSPNPVGAGDGVLAQQQAEYNPTSYPATQAQRKTHTHTASIASLISQGDRVEEGWSPIGGTFAIPPTPTRAERMEREREMREKEREREEKESEAV